MQGGEGLVAAQLGDFILEQQLSALHFSEFQLVGGRTHQFLFDFLVERIVALLERGQMTYNRHAELLVQGLRMKVSVP